MHKTRAIIAVLITVLLCCTDAYAIQFRRTNTDPGDSVIGQVTITNVDSADSSKRLNGAHIMIVNKDTGEEYTDTITDNGTLVYQLPLGSYSLTQVLAPNEYQLNSKAYEFTLQVPQSGDISNIKVVNASVMMTNDFIAEEAGQEDELFAYTETGQYAAGPGTAFDEAAGEEYLGEFDSPTGLMAADRNPATADNSNILLAILILSLIILTGGIISRKYLVNRI